MEKWVPIFPKTDGYQHPFNPPKTPSIVDSKGLSLFFAFG